MGAQPRKITADQEIDLWALHWAGVPIVRIAELYGASPRTIRRLIGDRMESADYRPSDDDGPSSDPVIDPLSTTHRGETDDRSPGPA